MSDDLAVTGAPGGADDPFVDTHVHFWDHSVEGLHWPWLEPGFRYGHVTGTEALDAPRYTPPEFVAESRGAGVVGLVHVQAVGDIPDPADETRWLQGLADVHRLPTGIVGSCEVARPGAADLIRRHAQHWWFCGIRDLSAVRDLDPEAGAEALSVLADLGLSIEARRSTDRLEVLGQVADRWPDLTVVLSHACLPADRSAESRRAWALAARELAGRPNVVCKISAVAGAADPQWTIESIRPWVLTCIDVFGPRHCMLGTNWPVDRLYGSYVKLVEAYRTILGGFGGDDRASVFHRTAARVYHLKRSPAAARPEPEEG